MKKYIITLLLFSSILFAEVVDKIVVVINNDIVTLQDLNYEVNKFSLSSGRLTGFEPYSLILSDLIRDESVQKDLTNDKFMLEVLVSIKLINDYASAEGIVVTKAEVDELINSIIERNNTTMEVFKSELLKQGLTFKKFRESLKQRSLIEKIKQQKIFPKISISDLEMENFYKINYKKTQKFKISYIYIKSEPTDSEEKSKEVAEKLAKIKEELKTKDFFEVASEYTEGPYKAEGGRLGWVKQGIFNLKLEEGILNTKVGEYTPVMKTDNGYHIFKLLELGLDEGRPFKDVKNEIYQRLAFQKWHGIFMKWLDMLKRKYYIDYKTDYSDYGRGFSWNQWYNNLKSSKK